MSRDIIYDRGTMKVIVLACFVILLAVALTGAISYFITKNILVDKLKSRDLVYILESISAKIDGRIERAKETSLLLAKDPAVLEWIKGDEKDARLGAYAKAKLDDLALSYDYANSFVVSARTNHYWAEGSKLLQIMSEANPDDRWFYDALKSGKSIELNIDYNRGRNDTFVFVNVLMGDPQNPLGVAGAGLSLQEIAREFQSYKFGQSSNLWLVDSQGKINLSDNSDDNGSNLTDFVPPDVGPGLSRTEIIPPGRRLSNIKPAMEKLWIWLIKPPEPPIGCWRCRFRAVKASPC